ncbi:MAG: OsmC family protein [candidate division WOR-3 bacterium]|jgi:uncharacterized OsmC-like protein
MIINNVNVEAIKETREKILRNEWPAKRPYIVEGEWVFDKEVQFIGKIEYPQGEIEIPVDNVPAMGGHGNAPNPVQICTFGMISCYAYTFVSVAAEMGIKIKKLKIKGYVDVNLKSVLNIEDTAVVEGVNLEVEIQSDADKEIIEKIKEISNKKCPAAYIIQNPIPFRVKIKTEY